MKKFLSSKMRSSIFALLLMMSMLAQSLTGLQNVFADSAVSIAVNGYQVNTSLQAFRTLYSVIDPSGITQEVGLIYGLTDHVTEDDMVVGSTNSTVYSYAATSKGLSDENHSGDDNGKTYVMTMKFIDKVAFYAANISVRAYAKLSDGTYTYSNVSTTSVYTIADYLYQGSLMSNEEGHNYLYNAILSKVNTSYEAVDYSPKTVVEPETTVEVTTQVPTTEEITTQEESTVYLPEGYVAALDNWNDLNYWSIYFASGWAGDPTGYYKNGNSYNDFSVIVDTASNAEWGIQMKTQPIDVEAGNTYKCVVTANANMATTANVRFKDDITGAEILKTLTAGTNTFELTFTAGDTAQIFFDLGLVPAGLQFDIKSFSLTVTEVPTTPTQQESTPSAGDTDIDYSSLTYTTLVCDGTSGLSLAYAIYSSTVSGLVPWYGDGGNTLSLQYSSDAGTVSSVLINNAAAAAGVVTEKGTGLVKINPNLLAANAYSVVKVVTENGEFVIVVKMGDAPEQPETTKPQETTKVPETTKAPEVETEEPTTAPPKNIDLDSYYVGLDTASCSTTGDGVETADKLFDNNTGTKMFSGQAMNANNIRIAWKLSQAVILKSYTLTTANDTASYSYRNPKKWVLYGSNDATTWIQIDIVDNSGIGAVNYADYTYQTDIQDSYQYYAIQFTDNGGYYGFQLSEISMYGDVAPATTEIGGDLGTYFAGIDSANNQFSGYNSEVPANLFDDNTSTKMFTGESLSRSLAWKMDRDVTLYSYSLTTANDNASFAGRLPKSWTLYGSTNGSNWVKLDRVIDSGMENKNYQTYTYTVNHIGTYKYFKIDFTARQGDSFQLSEIDLYGATVSPSEYDILFYKDWHLITNESYVDELIKLFYNSYPRLYKRWGTGTEPKTITFMADSTYDGVAYCAGTTVCVSTTYANANPHDIGFFSHEITHSVQQYGGQLIYEDPGWWTENMANYGGFRYFHWSNPRYVQVYEASDTSLQDWGWQKYGNNKWFFAYMDAKYPTTKNADGTLNYGLIDSINNLIKNHTGAQLTDDPDLVGSPFNNVVLAETGYNCMEALRLRFVEELKAGTWAFKGFGEYTDNWITEDIEGIPNPEYPMLGGKTHGNKTAGELSYDVTSGTNLALNARIHDYSGQVNGNEATSMLVDGNLGTKWCATSSNLTNPTYALNGVKHWVMLDLGSEKTFNTYTMYNTQSREGYGNATEWEILVSNDAKNWTSVDYQSYNNSAISSFNIGSQTARYVFIKVFTPDNGPGTLRLYEFQLYNQ